MAMQPMLVGGSLPAQRPPREAHPPIPGIWDKGLYEWYSMSPAEKQEWKSQNQDWGLGGGPPDVVWGPADGTYTVDQIPMLEARIAAGDDEYGGAAEMLEQLYGIRDQYAAWDRGENIPSATTTTPLGPSDKPLLPNSPGYGMNATPEQAKAWMANPPQPSDPDYNSYREWFEMGFSCPSPKEHIQLANNDWILAGELKVGDEVITSKEPQKVTRV